MQSSTDVTAGNVRTAVRGRILRRQKDDIAERVEWPARCLGTSLARRQLVPHIPRK